MARENKTLPVQNGLESFWLAESHDLSNHRTTASIPERNDIVIIGAGYAGIATAYHLLKESAGAGDLNITILEARGACSGATGRNGGHLRPDLYGHIPKYIARAGVRAGAEVAEFEIENMWAIKKVIEDENISCDFTMARSIDVWCQEKAARDAKAAYDKLVGLGLDYMKDVYFTTDPQVAEAVSRPRVDSCHMVNAYPSTQASKGPWPRHLSRPALCGRPNYSSVSSRFCWQPVE